MDCEPEGEAVKIAIKKALSFILIGAALSLSVLTACSTEITPERNAGYSSREAEPGLSESSYHQDEQPITGDNPNVGNDYVFGDYESADREEELWQDAYANFLRSGEYTHRPLGSYHPERFRLIDMDSNGVPELIIFDEGILQCSVYLNIGDAVTLLEIFGGGTGSWAWPYPEGILLGWRGADVEDNYVAYKGGQWVDLSVDASANQAEVYEITSENIQKHIYGYISGAGAQSAQASSSAPSLDETVISDTSARTLGKEAAAAYLNVLQSHSNIGVAEGRFYSFSNSNPVSIYNICGDDTPELLFFQDRNDMTSLKIWTYTNGVAVQIANIEFWAAGAGAYYPILMLDDGRFCYYSENGEMGLTMDDWVSWRWYQFYALDSNGFLAESDRLSVSYVNNVADSAQMNGVGISAQDFLLLEQDALSSVESLVLLYADNEDYFLSRYSFAGMSYAEAVALLSAAA